MRIAGPTAIEPMAARLTILEGHMKPILAAQGLRHYEDFVAIGPGELIHRSRTAETRRLTLDAGDTLTVFLKVYRYAGRHRRSRLRQDTAEREANNYAVLREDCGVDVPDVIAHGSRRRGLRLLDAFILTRGVPDAVPLDAFAARRWPDPTAVGDDPLRRFLLAETADMVARMHAIGFYHIDLQWRNLLIAAATAALPRIVVIDSARGAMRRWSLHRAHGRIRDLSSLHKEARARLSTREQLRWLRRYLGVRRFRPEHRALIHTIRHDRGIKDEGPSS